MNTDFIELPEWGLVKRQIWPEYDPLCGTFVHTQYLKDEKLVQEDLHLEVARGAMLKGLVNL